MIERPTAVAARSSTEARPTIAVSTRLIETRPSCASEIGSEAERRREARPRADVGEGGHGGARTVAQAEEAPAPPAGAEARRRARVAKRKHNAPALRCDPDPMRARCLGECTRVVRRVLRGCPDCRSLGNHSYGLPQTHSRRCRNSCWPLARPRKRAQDRPGHGHRSQDGTAVSGRRRGTALTRDCSMTEADVGGLIKRVQSRSKAVSSATRAELAGHEGQISAWLSQSPPLRLREVHRRLVAEGVRVTYWTLRRFAILIRATRPTEPTEEVREPARIPSVVPPAPESGVQASHRVITAVSYPHTMVRQSTG